MNIYTTPYGMSLEQRQKETESKLRGLIDVASEDIMAVGEYEDIYYLNPTNDSIRQWDFPAIINGKAYIDIRAYTNSKGQITQRPQYNAMVELAILELEWVTNLENFQLSGAITASIYGYWVSRMIANRYQRSHLDTSLVQAAFTCLYLLYLYPDNKDIQEKVMKGDFDIELKKKIDRYTELPLRFIEDTLFTELDDSPSITTALGRARSKGSPQIGYMQVILEWLNQRMESPIEDLTSPVLVSLAVRGSWVGHLNGPLSSLSLYHPPVFMSLIIRSLEYSFYQRTSIGRSVKDMQRKVKIKDFENWFKSLEQSSKA